MLGLKCGQLNIGVPAGWPACYGDVKAGIRAAASDQSGHHRLSERVLMDHSAGGHLALLAGGEVPALAQGIGLSAITDIKAYFAGNNRDQKVTADFMQGSVLQKLAQYTLANPSEQPQDVNRYLLQGALDIIVPAKVWARCVVARSGAL